MTVEAIEAQGRALYEQYAPYRVSLPEGERGKWKVSHFETTMGIEYLRDWRDGRSPGLGRHTRLTHKLHGVVMSDTAPEIQDLQRSLLRLRGDVLVTGLGLGMTVHALTKIQKYSDHIRSVTVVEKSRDVYDLVADEYLRDSRVRIYIDDAHQWVPPHGAKYDAAWHDIWNTISSDNLASMRKIKLHYAPFMKSKKSQFCWGEDVINRWGD